MKYKMSKEKLTKLSDLFITTMVLAWIITIGTSTYAAFYSMIMFNDSSVWSEVCNLVVVPLTAGGVIWLFKQQPDAKQVEDTDYTDDAEG